MLLEDSDYLKKTRSWYHEEKQFLYNELKTVPHIKVIESETNFFLIKLLKSDASSLREHLLNKKIYVRSCDDFQGLSNKFIRIAVRKRRENSKLILELKQYMKS